MKKLFLSLLLFPLIISGQTNTVETIDENGWKEMKIYKNGRLEGIWKKWDIDGQLRFESNVTYGNDTGYENLYLRYDKKTIGFFFGDFCNYFIYV